MEKFDSDHPQGLKSMRVCISLPLNSSCVSFQVAEGLVTAQTAVQHQTLEKQGILCMTSCRLHSEVTLKHRPQCLPPHQFHFKRVLTSPR